MLASTPWRNRLPKEARAGIPALARGLQQGKVQERTKLAEQRIAKTEDSFETTITLLLTLTKWKFDSITRDRVHIAVSELCGVDRRMVFIREVTLISSLIFVLTLISSLP